MASSFRRANKSAVYLKLAITGPSGSGKTTAALRLARGLVGPKGRIAVIDTENSSSLLYADSFNFDVCVVEPPYTEDKFIKAVADASGNYDCVVIDSFSHVWQAILEYKSKLDMRGGNSYTNWANAGNRFENVLQAVLSSKMHIICCMRSKMDYAIDTDERGKKSIRKVGLAPIMRDGIEFEFSLVLDLDMNHKAVASKDRTRMFDGKIEEITERTGELLDKWRLGKTVAAAEIIRRYDRPALFLADAKELVHQAAEKIGAWTGAIPDIETGESHACGSSQIVVGTTQSVSGRLFKYYPEDISLIIVDEAHRNTLGSRALRVLNYFSRAKVVGITATPYRSDKKLLGSFYEKVSCEIGLFELIAQGYLSRIVVKSVPVDVDLKSVRSRNGDYDEGDLAKALSPHLAKCAELLKKYAADRKTVVFLPLVETSRLFCKLCRDIGLNAVHVDGNDRAALRSDWRVICNASLLTTGWDEPSVDCVYILRPTKSQVLFSQMVGRGTRICKGKDYLLLLDPLFLSDDLNLIRPARLVAKDPEEAVFLQSRLDTEGGDLMVEADRAKSDRAKSMQERLIETRTKSSRTIDAMELALSLDRFDIVDYEPEFRWERQPISDGQKSVLAGGGFDTDIPEMCRGLASKIIDLLYQRREMGLATPRQVRLFRRLGFKNAATVSFDEAKRMISARLDGKAQHDGN